MASLVEGTTLYWCLTDHPAPLLRHLKASSVKMTLTFSDVYPTQPCLPSNPPPLSPFQRCQKPFPAV